MTKNQIEQYIIRYEIEGYNYYVDGSRATEMAHRISNSKVNKKIYGEDIINHNFNLVPCNHNDNDSFNIGMNLEKSRRLVELIKTRGNERLTCEYISGVINDY